MSTRVCDIDLTLGSAMLNSYRDKRVTPENISSHYEPAGAYISDSHGRFLGI